MTTRFAERCGLYQAALAEAERGITAALTLPAGERERALSALRAYVTGALARGAAMEGAGMPLTYCSHCGSAVQGGTCTNTACPLNRKQGR